MRKGKSVNIITLNMVLCVLASLVQVPHPAQAIQPERDVSYTQSRSTTKPSSPQSPEVIDPNVVLTKNSYSNWLVGGGFLYYWGCYSNPSLVTQVQSDSSDGPQRPSSPSSGGYIGFLKRRPINGGIERTLSSDAFCPSIGAIAADETGLYYYDSQKLAVFKRSASDPFTATSLYTTTQVSAIALDASNLYWLQTNGGLLRQNKSGTPAQLMAFTGSSPLDLVVGGTTLYWFDSNGLRRVNSSCDFLSCTPDTLTPEQGSSLSYGPHRFSSPLVLGPSSLLYWVSNNTVREYSCNAFILNGCHVATLYPTVAHPLPAGWKIGSLSTDGTYVFWIENHDVCGGGILGCSPSIDGQLNRLTLDDGSINPIVAQTGGYNINTYGPVQAASPYVYFDYSLGMGRIPANAPPVGPDLALEAWEVTQGIQSLNNDVQLVANKPTFVRVYGRKLSGPRANMAEATLVGKRGSATLPGSPLQAINGARSMATSAGWSRVNKDDSYIFQVPDSWLSAGTISLQAQLDPRGVYADPNPGNNTLFGAFNFVKKSPVCVVFIPVRTNAPAASTQDPNFWQMIDRFKTLWPVPDIWTYKQDDDIAKLEIKWGGPFDLIPYPGYGPYELPDNDTRVITSMIERDVLSDDPDKCDDANARTHYVGMVHPDTNTGSETGFANYAFAASWVKSPPHDASGLTSSAFMPSSGSTMAQEMSHNYNGVFGDRWKHVNCGNPEGLNPNYPYDPCKLDNRALSDPAAHFGFDSINLQPIAPDVASDYMSYGNRPWASDYSWTGMLGETNNGLLATDQKQSQMQVQQIDHITTPDLTSAVAVVQASGVVTPDLNQGELNTAWVFPTATLSLRMLHKWQAFAAPVNSQATTTTGVNIANIQSGFAVTHTYHLQLIDAASAVLDDRAVSLLPTDDASPNTRTPFIVTFPAPAGAVATMRLLDGTTVLSALNPGPATPSVQVLEPAGGETFNSHMTIVWQASDPDPNDRLLYTLQYSPDSGKTWRAIATSLPGIPKSKTMTLTLTALDGLPGSTPDGGLIRVAASDGYHTGLAVSNPFTVPNRPPQPHIASPVTGQTYPTAQPIVLRGGATDIEDGGLSGPALTWAIDGQAAGSGLQQTATGLAPGAHIVSLTAQDSSGQTGTVTTTLTIGALTIPLGNTPTLDGNCDDEAYSAAARVHLAPYADGSQVSAQMLRTSTDLWVCFNNIGHAGGTSSGTRVGVFVDVNNSRDTFAQPTDNSFSVGEDGTPTTLTGNGKGDYGAAGPEGLAAQVSANGAGWTAELRIPASQLGGWGHVASLHLFQYWLNYTGNDYYWPYGSAWNQPDTWARVAFGDVPHIDMVSPATVPAGSSTTTIGITGTGFITGTVVRLDGVDKPTTVGSANRLNVNLAADDLLVARVLTLTAVNPGLEAAPSNAVQFAVVNPAPALSSVRAPALQADVFGQFSPATGGSNTFVVSGSNFVPDASILLDGVTYPATWINANTLSATIDDSVLIGRRSTSVAIVNPEPGGGVSNVIVLAGPIQKMLYLPLIRRQ